MQEDDRSNFWIYLLSVKILIKGNKEPSLNWRVGLKTCHLYNENESTIMQNKKS